MERAHQLAVKGWEVDGLDCLGSLGLGVGNETLVKSIGKDMKSSFQIRHLWRGGASARRGMDLLLALNLIPKDEEKSTALCG
jgi:hypothetical protein